MPNTPFPRLTIDRLRLNFSIHLHGGFVQRSCRLGRLRFKIWAAAVLIACLTIAWVPAHAGDVPEQPGFDGQSVWQFRVGVNANGANAYLWIPPKCKKVRAIIIGTTIVIEKALLEDPIIRKMAEENEIATVWYNRNWCNIFEYDAKSGKPAALEKSLRDLAGVSGYPEIAWVPLVTLGHSASCSFAFNVAYWKPERVLAIVSAKAGYGYPPDKTTSFGQTPVLIFGGHIFEIAGPYSANRNAFYNAQAQAAGHCRDNLRLDPAIVCVGLTEVGSGHFEWTPKMADYTAKFISAAAHARLPESVDPGYKFKPIDPKTLWWVDTRIPPSAPAAPVALYKGEVNQSMRVFNQELAEDAAEFGKGYDRKPQWIGFECGGKMIEPNMKGMTDLPFVPVEDGMTFIVRAHFLENMPVGHPDAGKKLGHAKDEEIKLRIAGWGWSCEQLGPDKFRIRFNRAQDNIQKIIIQAYHPGNEEYRPIVQPGFITIPLQNKEGKAQRITFPGIPDEKAGVKELILNATSDSGLPVEYFVMNGPATIKDRNHLVFTPIPVHAAFPIAVEVVAYQWGRTLEPRFQTAENITRKFLIQH